MSIGYVFVRFHRLRHPVEMGAAEVTGFLSWLAGARRVAPSTHCQALSARLFRYGEVLEVELPWMNNDSIIPAKAGIRAQGMPGRLKHRTGHRLSSVRRGFILWRW